MGGTPTISGGMTYAEQKQLLADQQKMMDEAEQRKRDQDKIDEAEREAKAKLERDVAKAEEAARITEAQMAEEESIKAAQSMEEEETMDKKKVKIDFYKSLYSGMDKGTNRPL